MLPVVVCLLDRFSQVNVSQCSLFLTLSSLYDKKIYPPGFALTLPNGALVRDAHFWKLFLMIGFFLSHPSSDYLSGECVRQAYPTLFLSTHPLLIDFSIVAVEIVVLPPPPPPQPHSSFILSVPAPVNNS